MVTFEQQSQQVQSQINIGQAHFNLPPSLWDQLVALSARAQQEDLTADTIKTESWEPQTVFIAAGEFLMGSRPAEDIPPYETPQFSYSLPAFRLGVYPVTNEQYARFVREQNHTVVPEMGWSDGRQPANDQFDLPIKGISWYDALAYCLWLGEHTDRPYTLPSEAQWEKGARGPSGAIFPWGDDWKDGAYCNDDNSAVTAVTAYEAGVSPYGCYDMVGNIKEWTTTIWGRRRRRGLDKRSAYPWDEAWKPNDGPDELNVNRQMRRVTRGGTTLVAGVPLRAARRTSELPYRRGLTHARTGFRVALNLEA